MSIWPRSRVANTRPIAPTRATHPTTAFRLAGIVRSMRCGLMRPRLERWPRSRITSPSTPTVSTRSANRRRRPGFAAGPCLGRVPKEKEVTQTIDEKNKAFVLEAFETLFNKRDYAAAERFWSPNYIQHSAHIPPGREGLFGLVKGSPDSLHYENGLAVANGNYVLLHGRFTGMGLPANWIVADIVRLENGQLAEHWDVVEDEATKEASVSGLPIFRATLPPGGPWGAVGPPFCTTA